MEMTRKDYELIASALNLARLAIKDKEPAEFHDPMLDGVSYAADYLADALANVPRFDRARFLKACA
jgi:hypothetical protein